MIVKKLQMQGAKLKRLQKHSRRSISSMTHFN